MEMAERRNTLMKSCQRRNRLHRVPLAIKNRLMYSARRNFLYCPIAKTGSTVWRRVFVLIGEGSSSHTLFNVPRRLMYNTYVNFSGESESVLPKTLKFIMAREPYSRLLSGYVDKLFDLHFQYWSLYGRRIVQSVRKNPSNRSLECGHDVTFPELVRHITKHNMISAKSFSPITNYCQPCDVQYDIIGKMETFKRDTLYVLQRLNLTEISRSHDLQFFDEKSDEESLTRSLKIILKHMKLKRVSRCVTPEEIIKRKWRTFQIRGIIGIDLRYPFTKGEERILSDDQIINRFQTAYKMSGNREHRRKNRKLAFYEAYSQLDEQDLLALRRYLQTDCSVFGYDCKLKILPQKSTTRFFDIDDL